MFRLRIDGHASDRSNHRRAGQAAQTTVWADGSLREIPLAGTRTGGRAMLTSAAKSGGYVRAGGRAGTIVEDFAPGMRSMGN